MISPTRVSCCLLLSLATAPLLRAQEAQQFVPQFLPGKTYTYRSETDVTMEVPSRDGGKTERRVTMGHEARLAALALPAGPGALLDASTQRLQFKVTSGDKEMAYDSADEKTKGSALGQHFEGARQRTVSIEIDGTPKIVKSEEKGGGGPATPLPGMPQFGPDELKQLVSGLLQGFPPDAVKPGAEWTQKGKRTLGQFGEMDFEITYRYKGDEAIDGADCAIIEFSGDMKGDVAVAGAQPGSAGGTLGFEGQGLKGRMVFDKASRAVRESQQTVNLTIDVPNPDPAAGGGKFRLPMKQQVTVKLVSLKDS
jgi:hypothetical protein